MAKSKEGKESKKDIKIREIKSDIKILEDKRDESLEEEVEDMDNESFSSFIHPTQGSSVLRPVNPRGQEVQEVSVERESQTQDVGTRQLYAPRSASSYSSATDNAENRRDYEDMVRSAARQNSSTLIKEDTGERRIIGEQPSRDVGSANLVQNRPEEESDKRYVGPEENEAFKVKRRRDW